MYTAREVTVVLGMSPARLRTYLRSGYVAPKRRDDGEMIFSFQDLVLLRKAEGLVSQRIPPRRVHHALRRLRERLPGVALAGMRLEAEGREVVVHDGESRWQPVSGQVVFDFQREEELKAGAPVTPLVNARAANAPSPNPEKLAARELYERGCALEETNLPEALNSYRAAIAQDPNLADAHVNLGRLLHEAGELHAALTHYRAALVVRPDDATAGFNVGVALEDLGNVTEAVDAYAKSIAVDPTNADAHYNLARLLEQQGRPDIAIKHLLIYRQLTRRPAR